MSAPRVLVAWSSGKDSAFALHVLREQGALVVGLLTTVNEAFERVAMHAGKVGNLAAYFNSPVPPKLEKKSPLRRAMSTARPARSVGCLTLAMIW